MNSTNCDVLNAPLSLSSLINGGACFDIDANFDSIYDETHISDNDDDDTNNEEIQEILISPWQAPFDELRVQMERLDDNIYKKVINAGDQDGGKVPLQARVHCRYNAYWEGETAPFDSTYLRGSTFHFYTGRGEVLTGLECAVLSMCRGERSQFLISHKLLFGEMGCPPRVKPKAEGLFEIEVVSFNLVGNATADEELSQEERKKYAIVIDKVKQIHLKGLDFFGQGMYSNACRTFERAVAVLNMCHMANEQEELEQKIYLIKLYTNLAVCYVKLNKPKRTCLMCREINRLTQNNPSCKALFQEGRALLMLGEYERARAVLKRAYQMEPQNREIVNELNTLEKRFSAYKEDEKKIWSQALGVVRASRKEDKKSKDSQDEQFEKEMLEIMKSFKENVSINEFKLPSNLTESELSKMSTLAKSMDLIFKVSPTYNETLYTLNKPQTVETKVNDTAEQADSSTDK